jgi:hypothetical protein
LPVSAYENGKAVGQEEGKSKEKKMGCKAVGKSDK